jgi:hypothetical protein
MNEIAKNNWWENSERPMQKALQRLWIPIGSPGYVGNRKSSRQEFLDQRFGEKGWRISHMVRGRVVSKAEAMREYEHSYRVYLHTHPDVARFLATFCGNVYDYDVANVFDHDYEQPHTVRNHYQDISIRRVIAELVDDETWPEVAETEPEEAELVNLSDGQHCRLPRAQGFSGNPLLKVRGATSPGFFLNPAVIPVHDPALITANPMVSGWFLKEGCGHLSVEAFWQLSKVVEVRYDRFLNLKTERRNPLGAME